MTGSSVDLGGIRVCGVDDHPVNKEHFSTRKAKILLADDHQVNQQLILLLLERLGYRADAVGNGLEVLEALQRIPYDLILMDCRMPEMDGYAATQTIRAGKDDSRRIPIIALTANAMGGDREKCLAAGMDDYLSKPIHQEKLVEILHRWLPREKNGKMPSQGLVDGQNLEAPYSLLSAARADCSDPEALDSEKLAELRAFGGADFMDKFIAHFIQDAWQCMREVQEAIQNENLDALTNAGHALKGICQNMGANGLADLAFQVEKMGTQDSFESIRAHAAKIDRELVRVQKILEQEISQPSR